MDKYFKKSFFISNGFMLKNGDSTMTDKVTEIIFGLDSKHEKNKLFVTDSDFEIPHGEDYQLAINQLNFIQTSTVNQIPFLKLFQYNDFSLWWFVYQSLIPKYKKLINFTKKFSELIEKYRPSIITINDNYFYFDIINQICKINNIKLNYSKLALLKFKTKLQTEHKLKKIKYKKVTKNKIKKRIELYNNSNNQNLNFSNKIIFATPTVYRRNIINQMSGVSSRGDHLQQNIMNLINSENEIMCIDLDYTFQGDFDILTERLSESIPWFPIEKLIIFNQTIEHTKFLNNFKKIISDKNFQNLFIYQDISLWNSIEHFFNELLFYPYLPYYLKIIDSLCEEFAQNQPKIIFLPYETGPYALAIILASEKFGIKTVGIQHGYIYPGNPMYYYYNYRQENSLLGFPVPSNFLVFGDYVKKLLTEIGYPKKNIIVFGNSNFFELKKIQSFLEQKSIHEKYNIPKNKKIILFATGKLQPYYSSHGKYDYDIQIFKNLLLNFKNNDDVYIILKPHPTEKNISVYENLISEFSVLNASIIDDNLFELLSISSVTITVFSSVMIDSLCLNIPVIRVKFSGDENSIFDKSNAIISSNLDLLNENIHDLFSSEQIKDSLISNSKNFVKSHYGIPENNPKKIIHNIIKSEQTHIT